MIGAPFLEREELLELLPSFIRLFDRRPIRQNRGGVGFNHAFALYAVAKKIQPELIIESGVYKGQSTWLLEQACPDADVFCIDPNTDVREYMSKKATYSEQDFALHDWSGVNPEKTLCFFDDHQSAFSRLVDMKWWGLTHAVFEDNYPCGEGDCYSLKHAFAGFGHPKLQMSSGYTLTHLQQAHQAFLKKIYPRQDILREPNTVDAVGIQKNISTYQEIPPVFLYPKNNWGGEWEGDYKTVEPLVSNNENGDIRSAIDHIELEEQDVMFKYYYICYVRIGDQK